MQVTMLSGDLDPLHEWLSHARVLLVDDQPANLTFLRHVLETEGYGELIAVMDSTRRWPGSRRSTRTW
jgi:response regulator RpfG family c-di-GMP phosphodiesterase